MERRTGLLWLIAGVGVAPSLICYHALMRKVGKAVKTTGILSCGRRLLLTLFKMLLPSPHGWHWFRLGCDLVGAA